jgi:hypothetical protein
VWICYVIASVFRVHPSLDTFRVALNYYLLSRIAVVALAAVLLLRNRNGGKAGKDVERAKAGAPKPSRSQSSSGQPKRAKSSASHSSSHYQPQYSQQRTHSITSQHSQQQGYGGGGNAPGTYGPPSAIQRQYGQGPGSFSGGVPPLVPGAVLPPGAFQTQQSFGNRPSPPHSVTGGSKVANASMMEDVAPRVSPSVTTAGSGTAGMPAPAAGPAPSAAAAAGAAATAVKSGIRLPPSKPSSVKYAEMYYTR